MENDHINYSVVKKKEQEEKKGPDHLNYDQQHLHKFFLEHPAISVMAIEKSCKLPNGTIRHFLKDRRTIPIVHFESIENELANYGYTPLNNE